MHCFLFFVLEQIASSQMSALRTDSRKNVVLICVHKASVLATQHTQFRLRFIYRYKVRKKTSTTCQRQLLDVVDRLFRDLFTL